MFSADDNARYFAEHPNPHRSAAVMATNPYLVECWGVCKCGQLFEDRVLDGFLLGRCPACGKVVQMKEVQ